MRNISAYTLQRIGHIPIPVKERKSEQKLPERKLSECTDEAQLRAIGKVVKETVRRNPAFARRPAQDPIFMEVEVPIPGTNDSKTELVRFTGSVGVFLVLLPSDAATGQNHSHLLDRKGKPLKALHTTA